MFSPRKVLVIDDNPESRFLLTKTLIRKFPHVMVLECADAGSASRTVANETLDVVILHRTADVLGVDLILMLREASDSVPIIMVSGIDRSAEAIAAGANFFLSYDEWLRIGTVVAELLSLPPPPDVNAATTSPFALRRNAEPMPPASAPAPAPTRVSGAPPRTE